MLRSLLSLLNRIFLNRRKEIPFIIFFTFLVTFLIARIIAYAVYYDIVPNLLFFIRTIYIKGYHIHHFNFGIIMVIVAGFFSLVDAKRSHIRKIAILYGIGLALIMDEVNLLITLDARSYWGQRSYDAIIITALIFFNIIYFKKFWQVMGARLKRLHRLFSMGGNEGP